MCIRDSYYTAIISQKSHAGYYPESAEMILKLIFSTDGQKIFGAQIIGCLLYTSHSENI